MDEFFIRAASGRHDRLIGFNDSSGRLNEGSPVAIGMFCRNARANESPLSVPVKIFPATRNDRIIGITCQAIPSGACGDVQIAGAAVCRLTGDARLARFVMPDAGEMVAAREGWGILARLQDDRALIFLDTFHEAYHGTFAVIKREDGFFCCDTEHPDSGEAGETDFGVVPSGIITPENGRFNLYIWDDGTSYHQGFVRPGNGKAYGQVTLAELVFDQPRQCWTNGMIHWAQWYVL